ncbi:MULTISPECIES: MarR family winged helix-turn-helix transcriptional regulator [Cohaesibacter]|uniref:MarR family winged helix-turn-helix transcriptional regulator n=1 Tax=Cohaesibacter TaxID=655352 RepID=UPI000DE8872E|nr:MULTISPECIES: MarR family transcriptional regulator [Cohaesibacter]TLP48277.1 MarR family transcriptional regulator [Cohaesibacter sp. CAU 1516]
MDLDSFFPYRMAIAAEGFSRNISSVYGQTYGLSREEWRLLYLLAKAGKLDSQELSRRTTLDKVQVSRASQRLEDKKLITRAISKKDRRLRDFRITKAGTALFDEIKPKIDAQAEQILSAMPTEDRAALSQGIESLIRAIRAQENGET